MTDRLLVAICSATVLLFGTGCPDNPEAGCPETCSLGLQCDRATRTCLPLPLPAYERDLPGQAVRLAAQGGKLWVAAVDPSDGGIVVTEVDGEARDARLLASPARSTERRLAMAASTRMLAVAWLGASGAYEIAWRALPGDHGNWNFATVASSNGDYSGTEAFDLALGGERAPTLVFRDRSRALRALVAASPDDEWSLELVDDGGATADGVSCPDQLRKVRPAAGVGFDPDVAIRGDAVYVAYYDADCGDLRLAQRGNRWSVRVVDAGDASSASVDRGFVGRWPSIAFDPTGAVAIAYHDVSRGQLMFAAERQGVFSTEVVDAGLGIDAFSRERKDIVGAFASLTMGAEGAAGIAYFDGTAANLMFARRDTVGGAWSSSSLASDGAVGFSAMQVVGTGGERHIAAERLVPAGDGFASELVLLEGPP